MTGGRGRRRRTFKTVDTAWRAIRNFSRVFNLIMTGEGVYYSVTTIHFHFIFISFHFTFFVSFAGICVQLKTHFNYVCIHICLHCCLICWKSEIWYLIVIINCICGVCKLKKVKESDVPSVKKENILTNHFTVFASRDERKWRSFPLACLVFKFDASIIASQINWIQRRLQGEKYWGKYMYNFQFWITKFLIRKP